MNFLGFEKLEHRQDKQTDTHTHTEMQLKQFAQAHLWVVIVCLDVCLQ